MWVSRFRRNLQAENKVVQEGDNVEVYCDVTAGIPDVTVLWTKVATDERIKENQLNITNINQAQAGEYRCIQHLWSGLYSGGY